MKRTEGTFLSSDQKHNLYYTLFLPEDNPIALIQICHDQGEHIGYYEALARDLTQKGIIVCGCDQLGHGRSLNEGEVPGCIGEGNALDALIEDQKLFYDLMRKKYRYLPYLLLGQGMGADVLCRWMALYKETADGIILSSPDHVVLSPFMGKLTFALGCMGNKKDRPAPALEKKMYGYRKSVYALESEAVEEDALPGGYPLTADGYRQVFEAHLLISDPQWSASVEQGLPVMILVGEKNDQGAKVVNDRLLDAELCMQSMRIIEGTFGCALFNGPKKEEAFEEVENFVSQVVEGVREARMGGFY